MKALPIKATITGDKKTVDILFDDTHLHHRIQVAELTDAASGGIRIDVSKTWRPLDFGNSRDNRLLSITGEYMAPEVKIPKWHWEGRYDDGWIADKAELRFENIPFGDHGFINLSFPPDRALMKALPIKATITGDKKKVEIL